MDAERDISNFTRLRILSVIGGVQAAPNSHKVIFENGFVRVLEVIIPPPGATKPMHHHRWPSFFLNWDTGGKTPHVHYLRPDGSVREERG